MVIREAGNAKISVSPSNINEAQPVVAGGSAHNLFKEITELLRSRKMELVGNLLNRDSRNWRFRFASAISCPLIICFAPVPLQLLQISESLRGVT